PKSRLGAAHYFAVSFLQSAHRISDQWHLAFRSVFPVAHLCAVLRTARGRSASETQPSHGTLSGRTSAEKGGGRNTLKQFESQAETPATGYASYTMMARLVPICGGAGIFERSIGRYR